MAAESLSWVSHLIDRAIEVGGLPAAFAIAVVIAWLFADEGDRAPDDAEEKLIRALEAVERSIDRHAQDDEARDAELAKAISALRIEVAELRGRLGG